MQKEAYKITACAAVAGALAFMIRWIQGLKIYDEITGLPDRAAPVNFWLIGIMVLGLAILLVWSLRLRSCETVRDHRAVIGPGVAWPILGMLSSVLLALSGPVQLITAGSYAAPALRRILGLTELLGGLSALVLILHAGKEQHAKNRQIASIVLVLFACFYMVVIYKENAANPVVWRFAPEILALSATTFALYFLAGYQFDEARPVPAIFFSFAGVFFCLLCVVDFGLSADALAFVSLALLLGLWGYAQVANIPRYSITGVKQ